jgi:tRNA-Thr(GGU) m(6)t(6)A37 methyltransferase TsaA
MSDKMIFKMEPVGRVHNSFKTPDATAPIKKAVSEIEIFEPYISGLFMADSAECLDVVFYFHLAEDRSQKDDEGWKVTTHSGQLKGIFATRSPRRPNPVGITTVKVLGRNGNRLRVTGLDAVDGTPVLDIKACDTSLFESTELEKVHASVMKSNPRVSIFKQIMAGDTEKLLLEAGKMHGHYCPGLAMGVMAATYAVQQIGTDSDGLEDLLAIVETNNCLADGVQLVTGCSFGNNSLIFYDVGKTAVTLTKRDGKGIRVISRPESQEYIRESFPDFDNYYQKVVKQKNRDPEVVAVYQKSGVERAFGTLKLDFNRLFDAKWVKVNIPEYAPSYGDEICSRCGESVMAARVSEYEGGNVCLPCSGKDLPVLDGHGIHQAQNFIDD